MQSGKNVAPLSGSARPREAGITEANLPLSRPCLPTLGGACWVIDTSRCGDYLSGIASLVFRIELKVTDCPFSSRVIGYANQ